MVIYLAGEVDEEARLDEMSPRQIVTELDHEQGWLPHWLPGTNPYLDLYSKTYDMIPEAGRGGAETMLPEFRKKVVAAQKWPPPAQPPNNPGGRGGGGPAAGGAAGGPGPGGARGGGAPPGGQRGAPPAPGGRGQ